ncbi:MAG: chemotaxis protein CheA, partial [Proteobacteria bacterium]|nr:chemotaxis protein CheA [Pseudomonadota bacterium]
MDMQREAYREEAYELLTELETSLLGLEETPDDTDQIGRVFRAMHTIKGSGAMFGFDDIAGFAHEVETVFDRVREGKIIVSKEIVDLALAAKDQIKAMLDASDTKAPADTLKSQEIIASIKALLAESDDSVKQNKIGALSDTPSGTSEIKATYRIRFRPANDIFRGGTNPILLLNELRELGDCNVIAHTNAIPPLEDLDPESCYTYWDIILTTAKGINAVKDVFIFVEDDCDLDIDVVDERDIPEDNDDYKKLGEILVERGDLSFDELKRTLNDQKPIGEMLINKKVVDRRVVESALLEQQHVREMRKKRKETVCAASIRVDADKLDSLVDLVGELVTVQARLSQKASFQYDPELLLISEVVERLTVELRDNTMSIRMLPLGTTFSKFKRLVRDLSAELGKKVVMTTDGGETELDKTVIEQLNDPLVHIIRNCIDHGIESPENRQAAGKPRQGTVHLTAEHSGANVLIRISDDGAGLVPEAIRAKALEKGLIAPDSELTKKEIFQIIFAPGFSTAEKITGISGRGVGMDVVKRCIETLRGSIEIDSEKGSGTIITLKLPLTLAIIDGLLVKIGPENYVVPLSIVEECVEMKREDAARALERNMLNFRGNVLPYLSLRNLFGAEGLRPEIEQIVVAEANGGKIGLGVDQVIGQHQTVIKKLSKLYRDVKGISGATILGDGTVALILDIPRLVQTLEQKGKNGKLLHCY